MKKGILAAAGMAAALCGMGKTALPVNHRETTAKEYRQDAAAIETTPAVLRTIQAPGNWGVQPTFNEGIPPKMWGEYLQSKGRQKWTKSRRK